MVRRHRRPIYLALALTSALLASTSAVPAADEVFASTAAISLPNNQQVKAFDISYVDPLNGLYILGDRTNSAVDVVDTGTNTVLTQLKASFAGAQASNAK